MKRRLRSKKGKIPPPAGKLLRSLRVQRSLTLRDVHAASIHIARKFHQPEFEIQPSRLHEIEVKKVVPNIYRVYTLAHVYHRSLRTVLAWYNIPPASNKH